MSTTIEKLGEADYLVRFRGFDFVLESGGALTTREAMEAGEISFAHVAPDGSILCLNQIIGDAAELEFISKIEGLHAGIGTLFNPWTKERWNQVWADRTEITKKPIT